MSVVMQANDNEKLGKVMFLPLAEKMIEKHIAKGRLEAEAGELCDDVLSTALNSINLSHCNVTIKALPIFSEIVNHHKH